jgi:hypothetical protein
MEEDHGICLHDPFVNEKGIELENRALSAFMTQNINQIDQSSQAIYTTILFYSLLLVSDVLNL